MVTVEIRRRAVGHFRRDDVERPSRGCIDLHLARALQAIKPQEALRNRLADDHQAVVAQDHGLVRPEGFDDPLALVEIKRGALVVVIANPVVEDRGEHRYRQQAFLDRGDRHSSARVGVHDHEVLLRPGHMDCRVDDEAGVVHGLLAARNPFAVDVDLHQIGSGDLVIVKAPGIDEEVVLGPGHAGRKVPVDLFRPVVVIDQAVGRGELDADIPLRVGDSARCGTFESGTMVLHLGVSSGNPAYDKP